MTSNAVITQTNVCCYVTGTGEIQYNTTKTFVIAHPNPQKTKSNLLVHACIEAPENLVMYRGKASITDIGSVTIALPDYVPFLAKNFTIQLTHIASERGLPQSVGLVSTEVDEQRGTFTVFGHAGIFHWLVHGERRDCAPLIVEPLVSNTTVCGDMSSPYRWIRADTVAAAAANWPPKK
jgi:hypothetical protein